MFLKIHCKDRLSVIIKAKTQLNRIHIPMVQKLIVFPCCYSGHRFEDPQGMRRHKIERKKHKTVSSVVHIGKAKKYFKPSKKFDHSPHEVSLHCSKNYMVGFNIGI